MITNFLSPLEFRVTVRRMPNVEFFVQKASIPSISSSPVDISTPFNKIFAQPDKMQFANLDLTFIVDENMNNYLEIFNWMNGVSAPRKFEEFKNQKESEHGLESDISMQILTSHKNLNLEANFINCFPISLSEIVMDTTNADVIYPEVTATFQYDSFSLDKVAK